MHPSHTVTGPSRAEVAAHAERPPISPRAVAVAVAGLACVVAVGVGAAVLLAANGTAGSAPVSGKSITVSPREHPGLGWCSTECRP